eukprot:TRINITY_DN63654_c0_g1_i1.p1 TRINITY_DN63654_c0_g1~~TRINITY_DN63654_c0_g1_i1.p1  ORF type:complete len:273 (+),score=47.55 TRINITY_DN63654_c0_g1_i1:90-908(+)
MSLYEYFKHHRVKRLRADDFLVVLKRMGISLSDQQGSRLVSLLGGSAQRPVEMERFCLWLETKEQKAAGSSNSLLQAEQKAGFSSDHFNSATTVYDSVIPGSVLEGEREQDASKSSGQYYAGTTETSEPGDPQLPGQIADSESDLEDEAGARERGDQEERELLRLQEQLRAQEEESEVQEGFAVVPASNGPQRLRAPRSVLFDQEISTSNGSIYDLGRMSRDKYTLPSRRKKTEREKLAESLRSSLNDLKTRMETTTVHFRPDVSRNPRGAV